MTSLTRLSIHRNGEGLKLIYTLGASNRFVISIGVQVFNFRYDTRPELALPVVIFFFAQRFFMRGVVITGVEK